jgi:hypothetical protein
MIDKGFRKGSLSTSDQNGKQDDSQALGAARELLTAFSVAAKRPVFTFESLVPFARRYADKHKAKRPHLGQWQVDTRSRLAPLLLALEKEGECRLAIEDGAVKRIEFPLYFAAMIQKAFRDMADNPSIPFPTEEGLGLVIPAHLVTVIEVKTELLSHLNRVLPQKTEVLRLLFPENVRSILLTSKFLSGELLVLSIKKIRHYLSQANNSGYILSRLHPLFHGNRTSLTDTINTILIRPNVAAKELTTGRDFIFRFWSHLCGFIQEEYRDRIEDPLEDRGYRQAAHLVNIYNVSYREQTQKKSAARRTILKSFEDKLLVSPYAFSLTDLLESASGGKDAQKKLETRKLLGEFLEPRTKPAVRQILPEIVNLRTPKGKEYYVYKKLIIPLFVQKLYETSSELEDFYIDGWKNALWHNKRSGVMVSDEKFLASLEAKTAADYPLFHCLLNYGLLAGAKLESRINPRVLPDLERCLDNRARSLRPLHRIFQLSRKELLKEARRSLPLWARYRLFRFLVQLLRKALAAVRSSQAVSAPRSLKPARGSAGMTATLAGRKDRRGGGATAARSGKVSSPGPAQHRQEQQKAVRGLKEHFSWNNSALDQQLRELAERWNPLYAEKQRKDLVEDVNSMIRDFMRGFRRRYGSKAPDVPQIEEMATKISLSPTFARIRSKEHFRRYIGLYIVKILVEPKKM